MKLLAFHSDYRGRDWPGIRSVQILNGRLSASLHNVENRTKTHDRSFSFLPYKSCPFSRAWHVCHSAAALHLHEASSLSEHSSEVIAGTGIWDGPVSRVVPKSELRKWHSQREWTGSCSHTSGSKKNCFSTVGFFRGRSVGLKTQGTQANPEPGEARGGPSSHQLGESWRPWATHNVLSVLFLWHETGMWTPVGLERFLARHKW